MGIIKKKGLFQKSKEDIYVCISLILAIFPLSFIINSYLFAVKNMYEDQSKENIQFVLLYMLVFLLIGVTFILIYIISTSIKVKASRYSLLFILGIRKKKFWKILYKDYFITFILAGTISTIIINLVNVFMANIIWNKEDEFVLTDICVNYFITIGLILMILFLIIIVSIIIAFYHSLKKNMIDFWEGLNKDIPYKYDNKLLYYLKPILGVFIEIVVIVFCLNYKTIYYAAVLQGISFYLIASSTEGLRWIEKFNHRKYYKNIIFSHTVIFQYKLNSKLIFGIYMLNFLVTFVIGGFVLSDFYGKSQINYNEKYPFEYVIYGDNITQSKGTYTFFQGKTEEGKMATIVPLSFYENITKRKEVLSEGEIIYISQHESETFKPLEGKQKLEVNFNGKELEYVIKDSRWEIIFGENISSKLENIIVVNDLEFENLDANKLELWYGNSNDFIVEKGSHIWNRTEAILKDKENDRYIMSLIYIIGVFLILEGQGIIFIKQMSNYSTITKKYKLLNMLGISRKDQKRYFFAEIRSIAFLPAMLGNVRGILILGGIYFFEKNVMKQAFIYYMMLCGIVLFLQYIGYYGIALLMMKLYKSDLEIV